VDAPSPKFHE